jgi:hypothetical protein
MNEKSGNGAVSRVLTAGMHARVTVLDPAPNELAAARAADIG